MQKSVVKCASTSSGTKKKSANVRLNIRVSSADSKAGLSKRIENAIAAGAKKGKHLLVGFNTIHKTMEKTSFLLRENEVRDGRAELGAQTTGCLGSSATLAALCICKDAPKLLLTRLYEAAVLQRLPVIVMPHFTAQLAALLQVKTAACFAVAKAHGVTGSSGASDTSDSVIPALDELREYLLQSAAD